MFIEIKNRIPENKPELKIGPLSLWIAGYTTVDQKENGDFAYLKTPALLDTESVIIFSNRSDTPLFCFKAFLNDLMVMYDTISKDQTVKFASDGSEFHLRLTNSLGRIKIDIHYYAWSHNGSLDFEDRIDQSYLPKIILDLKKIISKFS
ncbi:MAG: hypothetical protein ACHQIM_11720 [Sphingobacteriales bacterium]